MSDLLTPPAGDDTNDDGPEPTIKDPTIIAKLREEIKQWKSKASASDAKLKEAEPVLSAYQQQQEAQKTEAQKAAEQRDAARAEADKAKADAALARKEAAATRLATKAGVDPDLVQYLDLSKLDLEDEKGTLEILGKLAAARNPAGASNPARNGANGAGDAERRNKYFGDGRDKVTIFGG